MKFNFYTIIILFILSGCDSKKDPDFRNLNEKQIEARIIKGKSTKTDIKNFFGKDYDLDFDSYGKEKWTYFYQEKGKNPLYSLPLIVILFGKYNIQHKLEIVFDHDVVASYQLTVKNT